MPESDDRRFSGLGMLASALAGQPVAPAPADPGAAPWTDGATVFIDPAASVRTKLEATVVQASLIAAGLGADVVAALVRNRKLAKRYLAVEGHRALSVNAALLPNAVAGLADGSVAVRSDSPGASLSIVRGRDAPGDPPESLVMSYNPGYQSVLTDLKDSTRQRMVAIEFGFPEPDVEEGIIVHEAGVEQATAAELVRFGQAIRRLEAGGDCVKSRQLGC